MRKSRKNHQKVFLTWLLAGSLFLGGIPGNSNVFAAEIPVSLNEVSETPSASSEPADSQSETAVPTNQPTDSPLVSPMETGVPEQVVEPGTDAGADVAASPFQTEEPEGEPNPAPFRIMFTSDIHGQVTTEDYESGRSNYTTGGFSKTASLIKSARQELNEKNSMLFDLGDNLYDYTTDYIYENDLSAEQPVYTALSKMDYDAVTIGNHEFEYTLEYVKNQLDRAGLTEKVVLSNVWDAVTKKHIWAENKIITKSIVTESGREMEVKVGLIGETQSKLSKKRTDYTGVLESEDIVENVKKEAALLKEQGADLVVVLGHTGIGGENPEKNAEDTGYALTKLKDVDVVLCGHRHRDFPLKNRSTMYDALPGIDPETNFVNGKPLVQVQNRGASLGVVDLQLVVCGGKVTILGGKTEVREVNEFTEVDQSINECQGKWSKIFMSDCSEIVCDISQDTDLQNYFGTVEDTDAIQLLNNIKISCALLQKDNKLKKYKDYPVVAASTYFRYGLEDDNDYIDISENFKRANIYNIVKYKTRLVLYDITGAQMKEWLEWSVSGYEEPGKSLFYPAKESGTAVSADSFWKLFNTDDVSYLRNKQLQYSLKTDYLNNWKNMYFLDGVDYNIDTAAAPRYDNDGNKINDTSRIISLTRNGAAIQPEDHFLIITDPLPDNALFKKMNLKQVMKYSSGNYRTFVEEYLKQLSRIGGLKPIADHNWHVKFSTDSGYVLKSSVIAEKLLKEKPWILGAFGRVEDQQYYLVDLDKINTEDKTGPSINTAVLNREATNKQVEVAVSATDGSGIRSIKYVSGKYVLDSFIWDTEDAKEIADGGSFSCKKNGVYSICAVDGLGNKRIAYVEISNINDGVLRAPVVDTYSNRKNKISGTAEPGATVYFWLKNGKTYSAKVKSTGKFSCKIPAQKAGTTLYAYAADSQGRASARTVVEVKRTGPNKPSLNEVTTSSKKISGTLEDTYAYPVLFVGEKDVYVGNTNVKGLLQKSGLCDDSYNIIICSMNMNEDGSFTMTLPEYLTAGTMVVLRTVDVVYRYSLEDTRDCQLRAPNKPVSVSEVTNLSKSVAVYAEQQDSTAVVSIGKQDYSEDSFYYDPSTSMYCYSVAIPRTDSTKQLKIFMKNAKGSSGSITVKPKKKVPDMPKITYIKRGKKKIVGKVDLVGQAPAPGTPDKKVTKIVTEKVKVKKKVKGKTKTVTEKQKKKVTVIIPAIVTSTKTKVYIYVNGKKRRVEDITKTGKFSIILKKPLEKGSVIMCQAQNADGVSQKYKRKL